MATPTFVNTAGGFSNTASGVTSQATAAFVATAGNLLVVATFISGANAVNTAAPTDTAGNTYTDTTISIVDASNNKGRLWIAPNCLGHASNVVTAPFSGSNAGFPRVIAYQANGAALVTPRDPNGDGTGSTAAGTSLTLNPAGALQQPNSLIVAFFEASATVTYTAGASFTLRGTVIGTDTHREDRGVSSVGTYTGPISWTPSTAVLGMMLAVADTDIGGGGALTPHFDEYSTAALALSGIQHYWPLTETSGTAFVDDVGTLDGTWGTNVSGFLTTGPDGVTSVPVNNGSTNRVGLVTTAFQPPATATWFWWMRYDTDANNDGMALEWANSPTFSHFVQCDHNYSTGGATLGQSHNSANYGNAVASAGGFLSRATLGEWAFYCVTIDPSLIVADPVRTYRNSILASWNTTPGTGSQNGLTPATGRLGIMGRNNNGTPQLPIGASVCGVGMLNRVITEAEMRTLMDAMMPGVFRYPYGPLVTVQPGVPNAPGPEVYNAFPTVQRTNDQTDMIIAYYKGTTHLSGDGKIYGKDRINGVWQPERQFFNTGFDDRDAGIFERRDGTLLCLFSTVTDPDPPSGDNKARINKSVDGGKSWTNMTGGPADTAPTRVDGTYVVDNEVPGSRMEELEDGTLIVPVYGYDVVTTGDWYVKILQSTDGGATWTFLASLHDNGFNYEEPGILRLPDGTLICVVRKSINPYPADNMSLSYQIAASRSNDEGATWSPVVNLFPGISISKLFLSRDGQLVSVSRCLGQLVTARRSVIRTSWDLGLTWSPAMQIGYSGHVYGDIAGEFQNADIPGSLGVVFAEEDIRTSDGVEIGGATIYYQELGNAWATQKIMPDADITTTGWTATPLFSTVAHVSDMTVVTATAA